MKHKPSIASRIFSLRDKGRAKSSCRQFVSMEHLGHDQPASGDRLTVATLPEYVRRALVELMRLMRTRGGRYLNLDTDDIDSAELATADERNYAFLWAAYVGRLDLLRRLRDDGADAAYAHPRANFNALHLAALRGSVDCVQWLLRQQCPVAYTLPDALSPLHFAAYGRSLRICRCLIEHGCRVDGTVLHAAVYADAGDCAAFALQAGASPNAYDDDGAAGEGQTPLHVAADLGNGDMAALLLGDARCDANARTRRRGYTPLHLAAENGYAECVRRLVAHGADVDARCAHGRTPLHLCCRHAYIDCVRLLLERGADVAVRDDGGRAALHAAVSRSPWSLHIVRALVERDADVNAADDYGYTCLHNAALNELNECVEYLIMQGANVAARTHGNVTALNVINRKTPVAVKVIPRRLDLALSYKEQNLKLNFRDVLRNSQVGEVGYLHALQEEGQSAVLEHPLCQAFLHLKWQKVRAYVVLRLALSVVAAILLSLYVLVSVTHKCGKGIEYVEARELCLADCDGQQCGNASVVAAAATTAAPAVDDDEQCKCCRRNDNDAVACDLCVHYANDSKACKNSTFGELVLDHPAVVNWARGVIYAVLVLNAIRIFFSLATYRSASSYFAKHLNVLELFVTAGVLLLAFDYEQDEVHVPVGACAVLCCWTYLMLAIGQLPFFGTYVAMFNKVLKEFVRMIAAFLCLLVGFTFTFCVLKPGYFQNPIWSFVRVIAMMTGEVEMNEVMKNEKDEKSATPDQPEMSDYVEHTLLGILCLFMILVTVVLMNLLVGIAVNDVEGLRKTADLCELIQQTKLVHFIELSCFEGYFPQRAMALLRKFLYIWPDSYTVVLSVRPLNPHEKRLPKDIMDAAVEIAVRRTQARYKMNAKTPTVEQRLETLETHLQKVEDMVTAMSRRLMRLAPADGDDDDDDDDDVTAADDDDEETTAATANVESEDTN